MMLPVHGVRVALEVEQAERDLHRSALSFGLDAAPYIARAAQRARETSVSFVQALEDERLRIGEDRFTRQDRTRYQSHAWDGEDECVACGVTWQDCEGDCAGSRAQHDLTVTYEVERTGTRDFPASGRPGRPRREVRCTCGWSSLLRGEGREEIRAMHPQPRG